MPVYTYIHVQLHAYIRVRVSCATAINSQKRCVLHQLQKLGVTGSCTCKREYVLEGVTTLSPATLYPDFIRSYLSYSAPTVRPSQDGDEKSREREREGDENRSRIGNVSPERVISAARGFRQIHVAIDRPLNHAIHIQGSGSLASCLVTEFL